MKKGIIQIAFLPLLLAGFIAVALMGFLGVTASLFTSSLSKLTLIGIAILVAYIVYKQVSKKPTIDTMTLALIIGAVLIALFVLGSNNILGLKSMLP